MRHVRFSYFRFRQGLHTDLSIHLKQTDHVQRRKRLARNNKSKITSWENRTYSTNPKRAIYERRLFSQ